MAQDELQKAQGENFSLRSTIKELYSVIEKTVIVVQWVAMAGMVAGVHFLPLPTNNWAQPIAFAIFWLAEWALFSALNKIRNIKASVKV